MSGGRAWLAALASAVREAGWAPTLVFVAHLVSLGFGAYARFPPLDLPMHLLGGIAMTYFLTQCYRSADRRGLLGQPSEVVYFVVVPALAVTTTVLWEFAEFLSDRYVGTRSQLGLQDTLSDMALGSIGSLGFLGVEALLSRRRAARSEPVPEWSAGGGRDGARSRPGRHAPSEPARPSDS